MYTGFEVPPPPSSVVLIPHCAHHIKMTQEIYNIIKGIGKMDGGGGAYVSPIWYYDVQAQNHDALFLTGRFIVLFSIHVVSSVHNSIFVFGTIRIKTVCTSIIVHNKW